MFFYLENNYFIFILKSNHRCWLQNDKKVLDHEFARKSGQLILYFTVKFFIENVSYLRDTTTVELYYLQAQLLINQVVFLFFIYLFKYLNC
jgi:FERM domain-containing protein 4